MTSPPCWPAPDWSCCPAAADATQAQKDNAAAVAAELLWALAGRQHSLCERTIRPCGTVCQRKRINTYFGTRTRARSGPYLSGGEWRNGPVCCSDAWCGCCVVAGEVDLFEDLPVTVRQVKVDGVSLEASGSAGWRVDYEGGYRLVPLSDASWPCCQSITLPDTEVGTFSVTYVAGVELGAAGEAAYADFACALLDEWTGAACRLPANVTRLTREGVSLDLASAHELFVDGRTGVTSVDAWLKVVNPRGALAPTLVMSAQLRRPRRIG